MPNNKIDDLRNHLFETLEALKDEEKPMDLDRARAIADVAKVLVETAKVEVDFLKVTGAIKSTDFLGDAPRGRARGIAGSSRRGARGRRPPTAGCREHGMTAILPGTPKSRRYRAAADPLDVVSTRSDAEVRALILEALAAGPLEKWRIRETIHEEESRISRQLLFLRDAGAVKKLGHRRIASYALRAWQEPDGPKPANKGRMPSITPKAAPPGDSWWIGRDRGAFYEQYQRELPRITQSGSRFRSVRPMVVGDC
jgi:hypothetical protein